MIFHIIVVFSVYVLFVGHDEPGGGFAAGLIVGLALALRYIAGGAFELGEARPGIRAPDGHRAVHLLGDRGLRRDRRRGRAAVDAS